MPRSARTVNAAPPWAKWRDDRLLRLRVSDLGLSIDNSWLVEPIDALYRELGAHDLRVRPHFWLSTEWFCPDGIPGIAIPFYLAHPRLMRLEKRQMMDVEGGTRTECLRILRHEAGHAIQHAYRLHRRRKYQQLFGPSSMPYPEEYLPNPASKRYVHNIRFWYAQSHPDEDFAETFAVWLAPGSRWRKRYADWPALRKIEYVDELMHEIAGRAPVVRSRARQEPVESVKITLREYYRGKRERYQPGELVEHDQDLKRIFAEPDATGEGEPAARFLRRHRKLFRESVARWTDEYAYTLDVILGEMIGACRRLKLRAIGDPRQLQMDFVVLLTVRASQYVFRRREWHAL